MVVYSNLMVLAYGTGADGVAKIPPRGCALVYVNEGPL